jgi:hypothetical protein
MWRGLTQSQKSEYVDLAKLVGGTSCADDAVNSSIGDLSQAAQLGDEQSPIVMRTDVGWPVNPQYSIIPRGTSGVEAAKASQALLRRADAD